MYERVKALCTERGISVSKLERELGFSHGSLSKLDKSSPSFDRLQKIADFFSVSVEYIRTGLSMTRGPQPLDASSRSVDAGFWTFSYSAYEKIRDQKGLKDGAVARGTGITRSTFTEWKADRSHPKAEKLIKISDFLGCSLEELQRGELRPPLPTFELSLDDLRRLPASAAAYDRRIRELVVLFRDLSDEGQERILQYARDLADTGKYKKFQADEKQA